MTTELLTPTLQDAPPITDMVRHIVERERADTTLCGRLWDRIDIPPGPLCEECEAEYRRLHPGWPLPGRSAK